MCVYVSLSGFLSFQGGVQGREQIKSAGFQIPTYLTYIHKTQKEKTGYKKGRLEQRS